MHLGYLTEFYIYHFQFLLGITFIPREIEDNGYAKLWGVSKMHHGLCENGKL